MASDDIVDLNGFFPISMVKLDATDEEKKLWEKFLLKCGHAKEFGRCDDPSCTVKFVMTS